MSTNNPTVTVSNEDNYSIIEFYKYVDTSTIEKARPIITEELKKNASIIGIDLSNTEFLDSHGIGFFVSILKRAHHLNGKIYFIGAHDQPESVLKMVGFNEELVTYCESLESFKTQF